MQSHFFVRSVRVPVPSHELFAWHERPGAFERLKPPFENIKVIKRTGGIRDGEVTVGIPAGPFKLPWVLHHLDYDEGRQFRDKQKFGPFAYWSHVHATIANGATASTLEDRIEYRLPLEPLSTLIGSWVVEKKLERLFKYRHSVTAHDLALLSQTRTTPMKILVTGSSGLVGSHLVPLLTTQGHEVTRMVRRHSNDRDTTVWNPETGAIEAERLEGHDAVIHLAGESIAERWTLEKKAKIRDSRVKSTQLLANTLARLKQPPKVLLSASAIGYYGIRGDEVLTEESSAGSGFLAGVCTEWERATEPAKQAGIRVINARIGIVLSPEGGVMHRLLPPFQMGAGGRLGNGRQYMSWIAIDDLLGAIYFAITREDLAGPLNMVSPEPVTNETFTAVLGKVLQRPTIFPVPEAVAHVAFGREMADELLLGSTRVLPEKLAAAGYSFRYPKLEQAFRHLLGK